MTDDAEIPLVFDCRGERLLGILHRSAQPARTGVLIIVGGPQYRLGSHRQFLLLARRLASAGMPVLRFDYRGMGDSGGEMIGFEAIAPDIAAAIDVFIKSSPGLSRVVLWGLCDAASAALFYASGDARVAGLVLLNPWVRTEQGLARAYIKHYYLKRLFSRDFWAKIGKGAWRPGESIGSFLSNLMSSRGGSQSEDKTAENHSLPVRMERGLEAFKGPVMFILSLHNDYVADEFRDAVAQSESFQKLMQVPQVSVQELEGANHTFSRQVWRDTVEEWTLNWVKSKFTE